MDGSGERRIVTRVDGRLSWKYGIYVGDIRIEEYMRKIGKRRLNTYVNAYMRKFRVVKADNPNQRILLFNRLDYRHFDKCFGRGYFVERGIFDVSKFPQVKNEITERTLTNIALKCFLA